MPVFQYIARTTEGERVSGEVDGLNSQSVVADLRSRHLVPVSVEERAARSRRSSRVSSRVLGNFYRQLGDLLTSGVPILRALNLLGRSKSNPGLAAVVREIAEAVEDGDALADCMARHEDTFPDVHVAMIRAGERGGFLEDVLHRLAIFMERQAEMRSTIIITMIYPSVLVTVGVIIVGVVMVVFVPKFKAMLEGIDLPLPTRIVMGTSDILSQHGLLVIMGVVGVVAFWLWLRKQPAVQNWIAATTLRLWIIGRLVGNVAVGRFCRILGTLLANGIPMLQALDIAKDAAGNPVMVKAIAEANRSVQAGEPLADPLASSGLFEEDVVEIIRIGESANNLDEVLVSLADTIETRVSRLLTTAVRLLEPMVLLGLGVCLLFIILALVVPMLLLTNTV